MTTQTPSLWEEMKPLIDQICREHAAQKELLNRALDHAAQLEKENAELMARVSDLSRRAGTKSDGRRWCNYSTGSRSFIDVLLKRFLVQLKECCPLFLGRRAVALDDVPDSVGTGNAVLRDEWNDSCPSHFSMELIVVVRLLAKLLTSTGVKAPRLSRAATTAVSNED